MAKASLIFTLSVVIFFSCLALVEPMKSKKPGVEPLKGRNAKEPVAKEGGDEPEVEDNTVIKEDGEDAEDGKAVPTSADYEYDQQKDIMPPITYDEVPSFRGRSFGQRKRNFRYGDSNWCLHEWCASSYRAKQEQEKKKPAMPTPPAGGYKPPQSKFGAGWAYGGRPVRPHRPRPCRPFCHMG